MSPTLRGFIKKELIQSLRDVRMRIMIFVVPLLQLTVFGLALSNEVKNIRLAVLGEPGDTVLGRIQERALASHWFTPAQISRSDPMELIESNQADVVLVAPAGGLTTSMERGAGGLQMLINASNAIRARSIEGYMQAIVQNVAAPADRLQTQPIPLALDVRLLYNPSMISSYYLVPGVLCMILGLITIILTSMSMAREKELGTFETLLSAPISKRDILLGKTIPYVILGMLDVPLILVLATVFFGVPFRGEVWELALAALIFIITTVSVGTLISTFAHNQQQAMMGGFLFLFPAIQLSGVMVPLDNIPLFFKIVAAFNPLNYFVALLRNIMLKGGDPGMVLFNITVLLLLSIAALLISAKRFHQTLN